MAEWWELNLDPNFGEDMGGAGVLLPGGSAMFDESGGSDYFQSPAYLNFIGMGDPTGIGTSGDPNFQGGEGGGGSFWGSLGGLASGAMSGLGSLLRGGAGGPLLSALGSLGGGAIGSNAANEAARLQSQALNRGIDLQTAQWLQQQQNLAPYLQAGQGGLAQLQQLAGREAPQFGDPAAAISGANYQLPSTTPGWQPQAYQGPQGPHAADYRYSAPATVNPANHAWNAPAAMDPSQYALQCALWARPAGQRPGLSVSPGRSPQSHRRLSRSPGQSALWRDVTSPAIAFTGPCLARVRTGIQQGSG